MQDDALSALEDPAAHKVQFGEPSRSTERLPDGQAVHDELPSMLDTAPAAQRIQSKAPSALKKPRGHKVQLEEAESSVLRFPEAQLEQLVAPEKVVALPLSQGTQAVWPVAPCDCPGGQEKHTVAPKELDDTFPASQVSQKEDAFRTAAFPLSQSMHSAAAASEYFPLEQSRQRADPAFPANAPEEHDTHRVLPGPLEYLPSTQLAHDDAPSALNLPRGHRVQLAEPKSAALRRPEGQDEHVVAPKDTAAFPPSQRSHFS